MVSKTIFAISAEESRFTLKGALLLLREGSMTMVATDGHRLSFVERVEMPGLAVPYKALLPRKAMGEILKLAAESTAESIVQFSGDENHLFFQLGDRLLISRKLTGTFPDFERVLPKDHPYTVILQRDEVRAAIERVSQFADERSRAIRVQLGPGELKVFCSLSDTGESEESISTEYAGEALDIGFNAQYLLDFLRAIDESQVALKVKDPQSAGELSPANPGSDQQYRYVVMPMRI